MQQNPLYLAFAELDRLAHDKDGLFALISRVQEVYKRADEAVAEAATAAGLEIACRPGCNACCPRGVEVEVFEVIPLLAALNRMKEPAEVAAALKKARDGNKGQGARLSFAGMFMAGAKDKPPQCFLLDGGGACRAYSARPLACRLHVSFSAEVCLTRFRPQFSPSFAADLDRRINSIVREFAASGDRLLTGIGGPLYRMVVYDYGRRRFAIDFFGRELLLPL